MSSTSNEGSDAARPSPFDPERFRVRQDFDVLAGIKKPLLTVAVGKPDPQTFFRVRPGEAWRFPALILLIKNTHQNYLIAPELAGAFEREAQRKLLYTCVDRAGQRFLWPVKLPMPDGFLDDWNRSGHQVAARAEEKWIRLSTNESHTAYAALEAIGELGDPQWGHQTHEELMEIAFAERQIISLDHPVVRALRGEV